MCEKTNKKINKTNNNNFSYYLSGFVEGEGCFSISYRVLERIAVGVEAKPSFSIAQKKSKENYALLEQIRDFFGFGAIRDDRRGCYKYETRNLGLIIKHVIPFFERYRLQGSKNKDFIIFSSICSRMNHGKHLCFQGLLEILELSRALNPSGRRNNTIDLLLNKVRCTSRENK